MLKNTKTSIYFILNFSWARIWECLCVCVSFEIWHGLEIVRCAICSSLSSNRLVKPLMPAFMIRLCFLLKALTAVLKSRDLRHCSLLTLGAMLAIPNRASFLDCHPCDQGWKQRSYETRLCSYWFWAYVFLNLGKMLQSPIMLCGLADVKISGIKVLSNLINHTSFV